LSEDEAIAAFADPVKIAAEKKRKEESARA
jgi:hypothetical protein